jgi:hypothetical protein
VHFSDVELTDDKGNRYKAINFGFGSSVIGQVTGSESIYPGKSLDDVLVFESPIERAQSLRLELPAENIGKSGKIVFRIPRSMIRGK